MEYTRLQLYGNYTYLCKYLRPEVIITEVKGKGVHFKHKLHLSAIKYS